MPATHGTARPAPSPDRSRAIIVGPGGLALVQRLARHGIPVSVIVPPSRRWVSRTRFAEGHVAGRLPEEGERWLQCLDELAVRGAGVLISGSDRATEFLSEQRSRIPAHLRSFESPESSHLRLMNKASMYELAREAGIKVPWAVRVASADDLRRAMAQATYPCVVKPTMTHEWQRLFGEHRVLLANGPDELSRLVAAPLEAGLELVVGEFVPGPDTNLENAVILRREDGSHALGFGIRKLRQYPWGFGAGSLHEVADLPEAMELGSALLDAAGFVGLATVEAKVHPESGERMLIEVNARITQPFGLGDAAGLDASWRLYATLAEIPLSHQPRPALGVRNVVPTLEPRAAWTHLARGGSLRTLLGSYKRVRDFSGLSLRDPIPVLIVAWQQLRLALEVLGRRLRAGSGAGL